MDGICLDYLKVFMCDGWINVGFFIVILNRYVIVERDDRLLW